MGWHHGAGLKAARGRGVHGIASAERRRVQKPRMRNQVAEGGVREGARTRVDIRGTHSSATCRSWCGDPGCRVDLLAADEQELKELRLSRQHSSACWTWTEAPPPAQKSPANLGGGL